MAAPPGAAAPAVPQPVDLLALDLGGHVEFATSEFDTDKWSAFRVLERNPETGWSSKSSPSFPQELVFSFAGRDAALISAVVFRFGLNPSQYSGAFAKDVEVWTSMDSSTSGFVKQGALTLGTEAMDQAIRLVAVEARYLKLRVLSNQGSTSSVALGKVRAIEAQRTGYQSLVTRNPELVAFFSPRASARADEKRFQPSVDSVAASDASTHSLAITKPPPAHPESRKVLVVTQLGVNDAAHSAIAYNYPPTEYKPTPARPADSSIFGRLTFSVVRPQDAWPTKLAPTEGIDTVVLAQICDIETVVPEPFKVALMAWVAEGHKLIMQDADGCGASRLPDYRFLPYRFATSNPGKHGSEGDKLIFVEENSIANGKPEDPGFLDIKSWMASTNGPDGRNCGSRDDRIGPTHGTAVMISCRSASPSPCSPSLAFALPSGDRWSYEVKWDGYRTLAVKDGSRVTLYSRNLDGELVAVDANGQPSFQALHHQAASALAYYVFDLLHLNGRDLMGHPLKDRRAVLACEKPSFCRCRSSWPSGQIAL